jgi:hypothetical protein
VGVGDHVPVTVGIDVAGVRGEPRPVGATSLDFEGCFNARDLGGLPTGDGGRTALRVLVRSDALDRLTARGWASVHAYGIRTVIDLRNDPEVPADASARPGDLETVRIPLDRGLHGGGDQDFWERWKRGALLSSPAYYRAHLERFPAASAAVVAAIPRARHGGVLVHCRAGRDRTGLISLLLLALAGVTAEAIIADYAASAPGLARLNASRGLEDEAPKIAMFLAQEGTSAETLLRELLATVDVPAQLRRGGVSDGDLSALVSRLREGS